MSDIEHDRRRPSKDALKRIARELQSVGVKYEDLDKLDTRLDPGTQEWASEHPEVKMMLRKMRESGGSMSELLKAIEEVLQKRERRRD